MELAASIRSIYHVGSGVLFYGTSSHLPNSITIPDERIVQVAAGLQHTVLVCRSGRVFIIGTCKLKSNKDNVPKKPKLVEELVGIRIVKAACGNRFTCFLSAAGELYTCGLNEYGQLGSMNTEDRWEALKVLRIPKMKSVAAGESHAVALSVDGQVYAAGLNSQGQLGLDHRNDQHMFSRVRSVHVEISDVACGSFHTALLAHSGVLFVSGSNKYGVLGLGDTADILAFEPVSLPSEVAIAAVACGHDHTIALTVEGTVWSWGQNYYGQLGVGNSVEVKYNPIVMADLAEYFITKVVAGPEHTALITDEGNILVCGSGGEGELGYSEKNDLYLPTRFPLSLRPELKVEDVVCVYNGTLVLIHGPERFASPEVVLETAQVSVGGAAAQVPLVPSAEITDWEKNIIAALECPICFKVMCAPIHQCVKGHNFCNSCHGRNLGGFCAMCRERFVGTRNIALESLAETLQLPCSDCLARMPISQLDAHGKECPERTFGCPLARECGWTGKPEGIPLHARNKHRYQVLEHLPRVIFHNVRPGVVSDLIAAHGASFVLFRMFDGPTNSFRAVARYVGVLERRATYQLKMEFISVPKRGRESRVLFTQDVSVREDDAYELLNSENAIVMNRNDFGIFFKNNQVTCDTDIVLKQQ